LAFNFKHTRRVKYSYRGEVAVDDEGVGVVEGAWQQAQLGNDPVALLQGLELPRCEQDEK